MNCTCIFQRTDNGRVYVLCMGSLFLIYRAGKICWQVFVSVLYLLSNRIPCLVYICTTDSFSLRSNWLPILPPVGIVLDSRAFRLKYIHRCISFFLFSFAYVLYILHRNLKPCLMHPVRVALLLVGALMVRFCMKYVHMYRTSYYVTER